MQINLPYTLIKSPVQERRYRERFDQLRNLAQRTRAEEEEWELLELLLRTYRQECRANLGPVELLRSLMQEQGLQACDLARLLQVSPGLVSDMLNYKKAISRKSVRILAQRFGVEQEAFNRPYALKALK